MGPLDKVASVHAHVLRFLADEGRLPRGEADVEQLLAKLQVR